MGVIVKPKNLKDRQVKRVDRIAESNPDRARTVASRISDRRNERGAENPQLAKAIAAKKAMAQPAMKMGGKAAKQAAIAIAMKKEGKVPKKKMGYGGAAASMVPKAKAMYGKSMMKMGGKAKSGTKMKRGC